MRLKKLKIFGFKSFADKVVLDFDANIIGIVGPNGCGKSNIVDAFRWVMGEQSAKSLRGDKMHDVIFAGSEKRKSVNYAEVSVTLTEINGMLPIDYEEVTITRRLYRDGDSEYLLNQQSVRLKDIQNLLLGSGIGKNTFSIFEQGKLDQIIYLNPLERRAIFDESAGIGRFLQSKKEALRKLEQVTENYNRIKDIHAEVDKQTRSLKKQAVAAKSFQETKDKLESLEKSVLLTHFQKCQEEIDFLQKSTGDLFLQCQEVKEHVKHSQMRFESCKQALSEKEKESQEAKERVYQSQTSAKIKQAEEKRLKEKLQEFELNEKRLKTEIEHIAKQRSSSLEQQQRNKERLQELQGKKTAFEVILDEKRKKASLLEKELNDCREALKTFQKEHLKALHEENHYASELKEKVIRSDSTRSLLKKIETGLEEKEKKIATLHEDVTQARSKVATLSSQIDESKRERLAIEKSINETKYKINEKQKETQAFNTQIADLKAREKSLQRLQADLEGFSNGARLLRKESQNPKSPLHGKLSWLFEYLQPLEGSEKLLAIALKSYEETCIVETKEDLQHLLSAAQSLKIKDFSVLCLEMLPKSSKKGTKKETLLHHIKDPTSFVASLIEGTILCENIESAFENASESIVGETYFLDRNRVIFQRHLGQEEKNPFLRSAELKTLAQSLQELEDKKKISEEFLAALYQERTRFEDKRKYLEEETRKKEMTLVSENFNLQRALGDLEKEKKEQETLKKELAHQVSQEATFASLLEQLQVKHAAAKETLNSLLKTVHEKEKDVEEKQKLHGIAEKLKKEEEITFQQLSSEFGRLFGDIKVFEAKDEERHLQEKKKVEELTLTREKWQQVQIDLKAVEAECVTLTYEVQEKKDEADQLQQQVKQAKDDLSASEKHLLERKKKEEELTASKHKIEVHMAEKKSIQAAYIKELSEKFKISLEEALDKKVVLESSLQDIEKQIFQLKVELEKAGAINMRSIEEFKEHEERFLDLNKQLDDLEESKKDLEQMISKLESESRKLFKTSFETIRQNFQKNFAILFNGGQADLKFTESSDVLEAGVEIIAKPPGKQMRSISLLSGGEKCMTALALLFSLFEVKPAPFCILDEVDAPLDDTNIERFTKVLQQFVDKTQFIIVTHNKKTMSIADILFGISMEDKGVSKLLAMSFEEKLVGV